MIINPIHTRVLTPPKDDVFKILATYLPSRIKEKTIVVITSKIVSIGEGRCIPLQSVKNKDTLIKKESFKYLPRDFVPGGWVIHTLHHNLLIPSAGIDESNALDHYILWPKNPQLSAQRIHRWLRKKYHVRELGVIITDSHSIPMRRGTVGISLAHYGFTPVNDYRKTPDLFDRQLKITQSNIVDGLASAAVVTQGEGRECTPLCLISDIPFVTFTTKHSRKKAKFSSLEVPLREDIYYPFIGNQPWKRGGKKDLS